MNLVTRTAALRRTVVRKANETEVSFLAAGIAYYAFVALIPLLLIVFVVATSLFGEEVADGLIGLTHGLLTPLGEETVIDAVSNATGRGGITIVGVALLFWTGLRVFRGLDIAFSMVYGVRTEAGFLRELWNATIAFVAVVLAVSGLRKIRGESLALQGGDEADQEYSTAVEGTDRDSNAIYKRSNSETMHRW